jgi:hypothetical protein
MAFNIETFKANGLKHGGARPSLFEVVIPDWPGADAQALGEFRFKCQAASIPPSQIGPVEVPYFGRKIKLAGDRVYADWSVTVMHDEDYNLRDAMETWHTNINQHIDNTMTGGVAPEPNTYKRDAYVIHYSKGGDIMAEYSFKGIFPLTITQMGLNYDSTNQFMNFDVDFSIDYWLPVIDDGRQQ